MADGDPLKPALGVLILVFAALVADPFFRLLLLLVLLLFDADVDDELVLIAVVVGESFLLVLPFFSGMPAKLFGDGDRLLIPRGGFNGDEPLLVGELLGDGFCGERAGDPLGDFATEFGRLLLAEEERGGTTRVLFFSALDEGSILCPWRNTGDMVRIGDESMSLGGDAVGDMRPVVVELFRDRRAGLSPPSFVFVASK